MEHNKYIIMAVVNNVVTGATTGMALGGPVGAGIGAAAGLALGGIEYGINKNKAKKDEENRPVYQVPPEVAQGLSESQRQALVGLPDEQKAQYVSNLQRGQAYSLSQNQSRKGGLAGIAALNENQNQGYANLLAQDAGQRIANQKNVFAQLGNVADNKQMQYQLNVMNPYQEGVARDAANRGALYKNVGNAIQLGAYMGMNGQQKSLPQTQEPAYAYNYGQNNNSPVNPTPPTSSNPFSGNAPQQSNAGGQQTTPTQNVDRIYYDGYKYDHPITYQSMVEKGYTDAEINDMVRLGYIK